jgi:predicted acetylornithine/succinylornithine family transaminase
VEKSFANKAFFCNSGAEANEAAIKLARKYSKENFGQERFEIVAAHGSFHGRTMAALSATGQEQYRKGFGPMLQGFRFVPFNDIDALKDAVGQHTCAVILEPVQAEGGVKVPGGDYFRHVRDLCNKKNVLLILDEVQTGIGRTGRLFAHEHYGIAPDIMTLAKGLGGGVAIGAMLATDTVAAAFTPGAHASTFGGNPLACAAAIATLETVLEDGLILSNAERMSEYLMDKLKGFANKFPRIVKNARGLGLLAGIEVESVEPPRIVRAAMDAGLLIGRAGDNVIRFTPPLIVSEEEIDEMAEIMDGVLSALDTAP